MPKIVRLRAGSALVVDPSWKFLSAVVELDPENAYMSDWYDTPGESFFRKITLMGTQRRHKIIPQATFLLYEAPDADKTE